MVRVGSLRLPRRVMELVVLVAFFEAGIIEGDGGNANNNEDKDEDADDGNSDDEKMRMPTTMQTNHDVFTQACL